MKTIAELLSRDLSRRIEEVIQVDQAEEQAVFAEIDEYIATDSIRDQYAHLLWANWFPAVMGFPFEGELEPWLE